MENIINNIKDEVSMILNSDKSGHGMDHINRVLDIAIKLSNGMNVDKEAVELIALLHDVDDYKIVGIEESTSLSNARRILDKYNIDSNIKANVLDSISKIGYSKRLEGIRPTSIEGMIVSDADMIDAMGACGLVRSIEYALSKGRLVFNPSVYPSLNLSSDEYKLKDNTTMINHVFEKLLKLKDLMLTDNAKVEANKRYEFMVSFLKEYFTELNQNDWLDYLNNYINN